MDYNFLVHLFKLWNSLSEFVKLMCIDRDDSHGYEHMKAVAFNSLKIFANEKLPDIYHKEILCSIIIVSWLHDVSDHKYDKDNTLKLKVRNFLITLVNSEECEKLMKVIEYVSYSKEQKAIINKTPIDFSDELGELYAIVRNIVSDADKLEALGKIGFERCMGYTKHTYKEKYGNDMPYELLKQTVIGHANEKLLRLKDHFIRTDAGKKMAVPLHNELIDELSKL